MSLRTHRLLFGLSTLLVMLAVWVVLAEVAPVVALLVASLLVGSKLGEWAGRLTNWVLPEPERGETISAPGGIPSGHRMVHLRAKCEVNGRETYVEVN